MGVLGQLPLVAIGAAAFAVLVAVIAALVLNDRKVATAEGESPRATSGVSGAGGTSGGRPPTPPGYVPVIDVYRPPRWWRRLLSSLGLLGVLAAVGTLLALVVGGAALAAYLALQSGLK